MIYIHNLLLYSKYCCCIVFTACLLANIYGHDLKQSIADQLGTLYSCRFCSRGQLKREKRLFPVPVRACGFGLAGQVRPSRPASARSFSTLRLNHESLIWRVFTGSSPSSCFPRRRPSIRSTAIGSVPSLSGHATATDGVHRQESAQGQ